MNSFLCVVPHTHSHTYTYTHTRTRTHAHAHIRVHTYACTWQAPHECSDVRDPRVLGNPRRTIRHPSSSDIKVIALWGSGSSRVWCMCMARCEKERDGAACNMTQVEHTHAPGCALSSVCSQLVAAAQARPGATCGCHGSCRLGEKPHPDKCLRLWTRQPACCVPLAALPVWEPLTARQHTHVQHNVCMPSCGITQCASGICLTCCLVWHAASSTRCAWNLA